MRQTRRVLSQERIAGYGYKQEGYHEPAELSKCKSINRAGDHRGCGYPLGELRARFAARTGGEIDAGN